MKKVLITGVSGMIGQLILQHCLEDTAVQEVLGLVRKTTNLNHPKYKEIVVEDFLDYSKHDALLKDIEVVYYCLGVYTGTVARDLFRTITVDYPLALANVLYQKKQACRFVLLSGQGADRKEKSKLMFALDKGKVENQLAALLGDKFYACRPSYIYPVQPRKEPNFTYVLSRKLYPLLKRLGKKMSITSEELALAMFRIGKEQPAELLFENDQLRTYLETV